MMIKKLILSGIFILGLADSINVLTPYKLQNKGQTSLDIILETLFQPVIADERRANPNYSKPRPMSPKDYNAYKALYTSLQRDVLALKKKGSFLRQEPAPPIEPPAPAPQKAPLEGVAKEMASIDETELTQVVNKQPSALLQKPYLQSVGKYDFLVIKPDTKDPFVTVVPNDIYYNIQKKCVNWLDSCSLQGIRSHLLQKLISPYK